MNTAEETGIPPCHECGAQRHFVMNVDIKRGNLGERMMRTLHENYCTIGRTVQYMRDHPIPIPPSTLTPSRIHEYKKKLSKKQGKTNDGKSGNRT